MRKSQPPPSRNPRADSWSRFSWRNVLLVDYEKHNIGLRYSEKLNYSDKRYRYLPFCVHMRIGRLVLSSPHHHHHCFAHLSFRLFLTPVFREICVFWKCVWECPQDGECGSRVGKKHSISTPPHARTIPFPSPTTRVLFLSDSVEGRRNFAHMTILWRMKHRPGGRNMIPTCAWPILILRGVSQPTPNAPEVPRTAGVCLDISNAHVPHSIFSYFHNILRPQNIRKKRYISPNLGPKACLQMII